MKEQNKTEPRRLPGVIALACLLLLVFVIYKGLDLWRKHKDTVRSAPMRTFWEQEVRPVQGQLSRSTYRVDFLNERFKTLGLQIQSKFGKTITVTAMADYHPKSKLVYAQCRVEYGVPTARVSISALMDLYRAARQSGRTNWHEEFELAFVVTLSHELEHFADDPTPGDSFESLVVNESFAWGNTCVYALVPMKSAGLPITGYMQEYHNAWIRCGSTNNEAWRQYIRHRYSTFNE